MWRILRTQAAWQNENKRKKEVKKTMRRIVAILKRIKWFFDELGYSYTPQGFCDYYMCEDKKQHGAAAQRESG